ncbi:MAG: helix-turn-helix transcriptional regulator [Clostridia bacterium]|nr:helix-turn-helix transcriptional regulator [Clostridia bacterium]
MNIGSTIYKLRTAKNLSQEELAERLDVSRQSVSKWETDASVPDLDKLIKLSEIFGVTLDELVGREVPKEETVEAPTPPPQVIVQQVPAKESFFTFNKVLGSILLLASVLSAVLGGKLRSFVLMGFPLYIGGSYLLTEMQNQWLRYSFWIYLEKMCEIQLLIQLWSKTESPTWKMALLPIIFVVFVATSIIWVRFYQKRVLQATIAAKYDRIIFVVLGWLVHLVCIVLYVLNIAEVIRFGGEYSWLLICLNSCLAMVYYTTAYLVHRKKTQ